MTDPGELEQASDEPFGAWVKRARDARRWSLEQLAAMAQVNPQQLERAEAGHVVRQRSSRDRLRHTLLSGTPYREPTSSPPLREDDELAEAAPTLAAAVGASRVGRYDGALVELVRERPGITVAQAAYRLGQQPSSLYPVLGRLEGRRELIKRGMGLHPVNVGSEQLWCEHRHAWQRPLVRGRKPSRCPAHR